MEGLCRTAALLGCLACGALASNETIRFDAEAVAADSSFPAGTTSPPDDATGDGAPPDEEGDWRELAEPSAPPLGSALFSGRRTTLRQLFERDTNPVPKSERPWPDVEDPGPDLGDFPNSAYTLPQGRCYLELAPLTLFGPDDQAPSSYTFPYLLRYGVTDDVEFRLFGSGLTQIFGDDPTTGFSPLNIDLKVHLWDDKREWLLPASSLEVYLQSTWGSSQFTTGWQPSLNMNFDLPLTDKTNLEWTVGYSGVQDAVNIVTGGRFVPRHGFLNPQIHRANENVYQLSVQWALEWEVNERLQLFHHGFYNGGILIQQGTGIVVGGGLFWKFSQSLLGFASLNAGLTPDLPPLLVQLGWTRAY
ncbi:MAG: hypothetical protein ACT4QC_07050 [Planctomycetaceae bacterium]